jgi:hypothetical protein
VVPVMENSIAEPFVIESKSRRKETSWGANPGFVCDEARICEMRTGRPVRVARTRRVVRWPAPLNLRGVVGCVVAIVLEEAEEERLS